jgi:hypothetical protein
MPHAALDLRFHSNPKVLRAGNAAIGLYARALSYCADHLTDGVVPKAWAEANGSPAERKKLTEARLWVEDGDAYFIPDYLEHNFSKERVDKLRQDKKRAGKLGARARWGVDRDPDATDVCVSGSDSEAANALLAEIADSNGKTGKIIGAYVPKLPPAAFHAAREALVERRANTTREPLLSEAKYAVSLLKDWEQTNRYTRAAA